MTLSTGAIQYILFHLDQHWEPSQQVINAFHFIKDKSQIELTAKPSIFFILSDLKSPKPEKVVILDTEIPLLFPGNETKNEFYSIDQAGNLIFHHDFISSSFYFLSGYGEISSEKHDKFGRFPYNESLQKQIGCITLPVVNYYFEVILNGIEEYCSFHKIPFKRKRLFRNFAFLLSHDVDRIAFYHPRQVLFRVKQLTGLAPREFSYKATLLHFIKGLIYIINPFKKNDPWWNLYSLMELELSLNIRSSWYFLNKESRKYDSLYRFKDKKILAFIRRLKEEGFEAGLHGSFRSATDLEVMQKQSKLFKEALGFKPSGIRQHYLRFIHPETFKIQKAAGYLYDTSISFAEHEGFRNGYCYPFKIYDPKADTETGIWEIPLIMMEVTVLNYRKAGLEGLESSALQLIDEAKKFGGLFSLLWHNCRMMDEEYPGVSIFYPKLLKKIISLKPDILTGEELISLVEK